ncbi:MAG: hypothetical protein L6263_01410 [Desulfobacteraceae bacterium]|nr:hypothetical protein [Desulfobacteraceae bacterium]
MEKKRRTVSDIKTALRSKVRSKPRVRGSEYLEMFVLEKNKSRLEQEKENVAKRETQIEKDISVIDDELKDLEELLSQDKDTSVTKKHKKLIPSKPMKTMKIEY